MKRSSVWLAVLWVGGLSGCVTPYAGYQGSDAAELTIISTSPSPATVFLLNNVPCAKPRMLGLAHFEANTTWWGHRDTKEFKKEAIRIPPNDLFKTSIVTGGGPYCKINLAFLPNPNTRYILRLDSEYLSCTASLRRIQDGKENADVPGFQMPKESLSNLCF